jgi:uncharacterized DUF497 family protein
LSNAWVEIALISQALGFRVVRVLVPNLLGVRRKEPEQVRDSGRRPRKVQENHQSLLCIALLVYNNPSNKTPEQDFLAQAKPKGRSRVKIIGFIWLENVVEKLQVKHNVFPEQVEEIFVARPKIKKMNKGHFQGEDVYRALGQTEAGRYLVVFFIYKLTHEVLILSARDMDKKERRNYAR